MQVSVLDRAPLARWCAVSSTVHEVHRTIRTALQDAVRRGHLPRNPATVARAPRVVAPDTEPLTCRGIRRTFLVALRSRTGVCWVLTLALGLRKGEGPWSEVDRYRPRAGRPCSVATSPGTVPLRYRAGDRARNRLGAVGFRGERRRDEVAAATSSSSTTSGSQRPDGSPQESLFAMNCGQGTEPAGSQS